MLTCLRVSDFAIIDRLELELGEGLNVVTGETGAGKSILVSALQLVLGGKGGAEGVRTGADAAEVEALFAVDDDAVRARLADAGLAAGDELVIRRVVQASGRTRGYVNGRLATARQLATLAAGLADISSQHEHHTLIDPGTHLGFLDAFGHHDAAQAEVAQAYRAAREAAGRLAELEDAARDRADREDLLRYQVGEIDRIDPEPGEDERLGVERARLRHAHRLVSAAGGAEETLYAEDGAVCERLARVASEVRAAAELDPALAPVADQLETALAQLEDAAGELGRYARDLDVDPARLEVVEERLDALGRLERKYGGSIDAALAHRAQAADALDALDRHDDLVREAERARDEALRSAAEAALALRAKRHAAAKRLGAAIAAELRGLGMGEAEVQVALAPLEGKRSELQVDGARLSESGIDRAEFLIAPNPGEKARPLRKVASGGELSRAMLAIKRVLAGLGPLGLYVFDEVDAGVGGAVAEVIGRKLREVSRHSQVLCITHLPQIAVYGDTHFRVAKQVAGGRTVSTVEALDPEERLEEVARMLGGVRITRRTRDAAAEMLTHAREVAAT
ncbi:MAG: DNA repair protein RecN [Myxococcales bacterium]|nr:DNA repair protein RecN [Myxococcales bacterium]